MNLVWSYTFYLCLAVNANALVNYFLKGSYSISGGNAMFLVLVFGFVHILSGFDTIIKEIKENK